MKVLVFVLTFLSATAFANDSKIVTGNEARSIMQALSASGFEVSNDDGEWSGKTLVIKTGPIICHYNGMFPDEWMSSVTCNQGEVSEGPFLSQSLAIASSLEAYGDLEAGMGNRWLSVNAIECSLKYDEKVYSCKIETN